MSLDNALALLVAADPDTTGLSVHLFKNDLADVGLLDLANFQECNYPGYAARCDGAWNPPVSANDGTIQRSSVDLDFRVTGPAPGQVAYGVYVTIISAGVEVLLDAFRFPTPVPMAAAGNNQLVRVWLNLFNLDDIAAPV